MKSSIPIFPLKLVVFPLSLYPLHIFEPRYKKMINRCIKADSGFGIVSKVSDEISSVGTYVRINNVLKKYDNGELDIIVRGGERFDIIKYDLHRDGYFVAEVEDYSDTDSATDYILLEKMQSKFEQIIEKVNFTLEESFWKNYDKTNLKSFKLAEKSGLSLEQQQALLTLREENARIAFLIEHLERLNKLVSENAAVKNIIMNDGYIN